MLSSMFFGMKIARDIKLGNFGQNSQQIYKRLTLLLIFLLSITYFVALVTEANGYSSQSKPLQPLRVGFFSILPSFSVFSGIDSFLKERRHSSMTLTHFLHDFVAPSRNSGFCAAVTVKCSIKTKNESVVKSHSFLL